MNRVIGVRFRYAGKIYDFSAGDMDIRKGMHVIVETSRGVEYGEVVTDLREVPDQKLVTPLKDIIRIATE